MDLKSYIDNNNMNENDLGWFWLDSFSFLNQNKKAKIYRKVLYGKELFDLEKHRDFLMTICDEEEFLKMQQSQTEEYLNMLWANIEEYTDFISINSNKYPESLREIEIPPIVLYYKGNIDLLQTRAIAVVGTRLFDAYGFNVTQKFVKDFVFAGLTVVSGMAEGLDSIAHKLTLELDGNTIAVLSGGINKIYPASNIDLCKKISSKGLILSEYPPQTVSLRYMFPIRNRIIAGISESILVTEAGMKSGVRYTVEYALENNRNVYVIPGNITSYRSSYCNWLIKSCQSMLVTDPEEILRDYNITYQATVQKEDFSEEESVILDTLRDVDQAHFDYIVEKTQITSKRLLSVLTSLELKGKIKRIPGNLYILLSL